MAADLGKTIALVGVVGVGGYFIYEYTRYKHALSVMDAADGTGKASAAVDQALGFMGFLAAGFSAPASNTAAGQAYAAVEAALAGPVQVSQQAPGTGAGSGQPSQTSVTQTPAPSAMPQPAAADLQKVLNANTATPDQWNYAYRQLTGYGIEQLYNTSFDAIYGPLDSNGQRSAVGNAGVMSPDAFLSYPGAKGLTRTTSIKGLGAIARFYTPVINPMSSMVYRAQHPSPYRFPVGTGMSGFTQATGFEKALWAGRSLRGNKIL